MDKKISELDQTLQINNDAVFPMSQDNSGTDTTYKASITQLSTEIGESQTFSNLQTTDKTLVGAINEVAQGGGGGGGSSNANLAPDYDATSTYAVGDWCIYNGTLYQCNTAIPTAEAFDPTHWTAKKVVDAFADIEDELDDKVDTTDFLATNLPIQSGSATNTKDYIDTDRHELLWTNTTHTSDFSAKTITPDTKGYSHFIIYTKAFKNNTFLHGNYCIIGETNQINNIGGANGGYSGDLEIATRTVTIATNSFTFTQSATSTNGGATSLDNTHCIPYKIFGIK